MPPVRHIQPTFAGGEFAPSLYARVDLQKYASGLKTARNFFVHPHGGTSNRPGTKYIATVKDPAKKVRVVSFEFSTAQAYVIEFGNQYCRFYRNAGQIAKTTAPAWGTTTGYVVGDFVMSSSVMYYCVVAHTSGTFATDLAAGKWTAQTVYEIPTPYLEADLPSLKFAQSADTLYICHPDYAPRTLSRLDHDDWNLDLYTFTGGPFMLTNASAATLTPSGVAGSITLTASAALFDSLHVGSLWRLIHDVPGQNVTTAFASTANSAAIQCGSTWRIVTRGTWAGKVVVQKSVDGGSTWTDIRAFTSSSDQNYNTFGDVDEPCQVRAACTYTSGTCNVDLTSDPFTQTGIVKITAVTNSTHATGTVQQGIGLATATADWAEGSWSDYRGWPGCVTFFQDRLVFAGTESEPQTIWMSETGVYTSYARNEPLLDSDGITVNLASRKLNGIKSMTSLRSGILALTSSSEWFVGPVDLTGAVTPTSIMTQESGHRGANGVNPVVIGARAIYVQPQGSVVRDIGYEQDSQGFNGSDLSIISNHLFRGHSLVDMAFQQEPDSLVCFVREDGILLTMTYMREQDLVAWTPHETDGNVESVCVIPGEGHDELWLSVKRGSSRFVERMEPRMISTDAREQYFVDAGVSYNTPQDIVSATKANPVVLTVTSHGFSNGDVVSVLDAEGMTELNGRKFVVTDKTTHTFKLSAEEGGAVDGRSFGAYTGGGEVRVVASSISGLGHLEGKTVAILADGSVQEDQVVTGGAITLNPAASIVQVGLPYTATFETLNVELGLADGTTQGRKTRVAEAIFRFLNSRGGFIGPAADKMSEIIQRTVEPLGSPIELRNEDYPQVLLPDWNSNGRVRYEQRDPLPVTILAVIPKIVVGG